MKKLICFAICITVFAAMTGCANDTAPSGTIPAVSSSKQEILPVISLEDVMNAEPSSEADFVINDLGHGRYEISEYLGADEIIVIPETINGNAVTHIGEGLFLNSKILAVRLPDTVRYIQDHAFSGCSRLQVFVAVEQLREIGVAAFRSCQQLHTVILNESLLTIEKTCFWGCLTLQEIRIPASVTQINVSAFFQTANNLVIKGETGSEAERYANENRISFREK